MGICINILVCRWSTEPPGIKATTVVTLPNIGRFLAGGGPREIYMSVGKDVGLLIGVLGGVVLPVALLAGACVVGFNLKEFKQVLGVTLCTILAFGLMFLMTWVAQKW